MEFQAPEAVQGTRSREQLISYLMHATPRKCIDGVPLQFVYGTAGFRARATHLPSVVARVGVVAAVRALSIPNARTIGVMITASHNPECDNGVKIIEPDGGMLDMEWEE
uniref:Putative phosphoacetylglucosamine mutase 1 n=1 Tax=Lygus hesperus TaxID=30085 RepID=A0A146LS24_LYGHE